MNETPETPSCAECGHPAGAPVSPFCVRCGGTEFVADATTRPGPSGLRWFFSRGFEPPRRGQGV